MKRLRAFILFLVLIVLAGGSATYFRYQSLDLGLGQGVSGGYIGGLIEIDMADNLNLLLEAIKGNQGIVNTKDGVRGTQAGFLLTAHTRLDFLNRFIGGVTHRATAKGRQALDGNLIKFLKVLLQQGEGIGLGVELF